MQNIHILLEYSNISETEYSNPIFSESHSRKVGDSLLSVLAAVCYVGSARDTKENMDDLEIQNVLIGSDGSCWWWTRIEQASSYCPLDVSWFPFDTQRCSLTFESWTMNSQEMNMTAMIPGIDLEKYQLSGEWDLTGERNLYVIVFVLKLSR